MGSNLILEGEDRHKFFIIAHGQVEILSKGLHGEELRIALLSEGEYFGEEDFVTDRSSDVTVRAITPGVFFTLSGKDLEAIFNEIPNSRKKFEQAREDYARLRSSVNKHGERHIDLVSGLEEDHVIPETYVDYAIKPKEYSLNAIQTIVRVDTRVSDLYNDPHNQLEQQLRLTIEGMKEKQEWELINNKEFILIFHFFSPMLILK